MPRRNKLERVKTSALHYERANIIDCPQCKVKAGVTCIRIDGKGSRTHWARVMKWEKDDNAEK